MKLILILALALATQTKTAVKEPVPSTAKSIETKKLETPKIQGDFVEHKDCWLEQMELAI